jgi:hypothetical protein
VHGGRRSRRTLARVLVAFLVVALLVPPVASALTYDPDERTAPASGTVTNPAAGTTVVSTQGYTFDGRVNPKKPARLVAAGPEGDTRWTYQSRDPGAWFFDVDPLPDGNLLVVSPRDGATLVYELDPETERRVWERRLPFEDTHDVDLLSEDELVVSHMRAWNPENRTSGDRVVVYNLTTDEVTWSWRYREHFPADTDGGQNPDWTHSNDVDPIPGGRLLLSPRNFDQVLIVNRSTKEITNRLGADDDYAVLKEQHNPDYLVSENGTPTLLVADSGNNRVVEYAFEDGAWTRTWSVGSDSLNWPRDADRLPNGNTLVTDTLNHRVLEITPTGDVVWEYHVTWGPYDAERVAYGDGSTSGPTIRDLDASGTYDIEDGDAGGDVPAAIRETFDGTPLAGPARSLAVFWGHYAPWVRPVWMGSWDLLASLLAGALVVGWVGAEVGRVAYGRVRRLQTAGQAR